MSEHMEPIPSRVYNAAVGGHVAGADQIIDDTLGLEQSSINEDVAPMPYNDGNPNGMGRIILKKTDNFKNVVEAQSGNTIFIIKYDFTLSGDVTVPANCVLEFYGGSINGDDLYTVTLNNSEIVDGNFRNITLSGTIKNKEVFTDWYNITNLAADLQYNNSSILSLLSLAESNDSILVINRDIAISTPLTITRCILNCIGTIYYYGTSNSSALIFNNNSSFNNQTKVEHIIKCECILPSSVNSLQSFKDYNIVGIEIQKDNSLTTRYHVKFVKNFTIGLLLKPNSANGIYTSFYDINIINSYIGIKFDRGEYWVNSCIFDKGNIYNFSDFYTYRNNIGIYFYATTGGAHYGDHTFNDIRIDEAQHVIYTNTQVQASRFIDIRIENNDPDYDKNDVIIEDISETYSDISQKSIFIPYSSSRIPKNVYKSFYVVYKDDIVNIPHVKEFNLSYVGDFVSTSDNFVSCNLPISVDSFDSDILDLEYVSTAAEVNNLPNFVRNLPSVILDVSNQKDINYFIFTKYAFTDTETLLINISGYDENGNKINLQEGVSYRNTSSAGTKNLCYRGDIVSGINEANILILGIPASCKKLVFGFRSTPIYIRFVPVGNYDIIEDTYVRNRLDVPRVPTQNVNGGFYYNIFNTTTNKPIWYNGSAWVDATGTQV